VQEGSSEGIARTDRIHDLNRIAGRFDIVPAHQNCAPERTASYADSGPFVRVCVIATELLKRTMPSAEHVGNGFDFLMIQFHDGRSRHKQVNQLWRVTVGAKIHIVKAARGRCPAEKVFRQLPSLRINLMQRSEVNPIHRTRKQSIRLSRRKLGEIVSCWAVKNELRLPIASQRHRSSTGWMIFVGTKIISRQAKSRHVIGDLTA
jgi:hypothetical protein